MNEKEERKIITRAIGSRFLYDGVVIEVMENTRGPEGYCDGGHCYFEGDCSAKAESFICRGTCSEFSRLDGRDVFFKEVKS